MVIFHFLGKKWEKTSFLGRFLTPKKGVRNRPKPSIKDRFFAKKKIALKGHKSIKMCQNPVFKGFGGSGPDPKKPPKMPIFPLFFPFLLIFRKKRFLTFFLQNGQKWGKMGKNGEKRGFDAILRVEGVCDARKPTRHPSGRCL